MLRYELRTYSFFLSAHDDYSKDLAELEEKIGRLTMSWMSESFMFAFVIVLC